MTPSKVQMSLAVAEAIVTKRLVSWINYSNGSAVKQS